MQLFDYFRTVSQFAAKIDGYLVLMESELLPPRILRAWEEGGLLAPAFKGELERSWINVVAHQAAVAALGYKMAKRLEPALYHEHSCATQIAEACLIHDWDKRRGDEVVVAARNAGEDVLAARIKGKQERESVLPALGFSQAVIHLAKTTGDDGLELMMKGGATLAEKLVYYADNCVSNDRVIGYKERFDIQERDHNRPGGRYAETTATYQARFGMGFREAWDSVNIPLGKELAGLLGVSDAEKIIDVMKD